MNESKELKYQELKDKVREKLELEYSEYKKNLLKMPKEEIFDMSYQTTVKGEIKDILEDMNMFPRELEALLHKKDVLSEYYYNWLKVDLRLGDSLMFWIDESLSQTVRNYYHNRTTHEFQGIEDTLGKTEIKINGLENLNIQNGDNSINEDFNKKEGAKNSKEDEETKEEKDKDENERE